MKKRLFLVFTSMILTFFSCGKRENGTYYPDSVEMQENLEKHGYVVKISSLESDKKGRWLSAEKVGEYLEFYLLENAEYAEIISEELEKKYVNYEKLVCIKNDEKFGTLVFCGSDSAVEASGIRNVNVKVDTKVDVKVDTKVDVKVNVK